MFQILTIFYIANALGSWYSKQENYQINVHFNLDAEIEYANNLRSTLYNGTPGQNSTIIQFNIQQAQK